MNLKRADIPADGRLRRRCSNRFDKMKSTLDHGMGWANRTISSKGRKGMIPGVGLLLSTARQKISGLRQRYSKGITDNGQGCGVINQVIHGRALDRVYVQPSQGTSSLTLVGDEDEPKMSCIMSSSESMGTLVSPPTRNSDNIEIKRISVLEVKAQYSPDCDTSTWERSYASGRKRHLIYYELPEPWRENPYLLYGHRFYHSHKKSILSIFNVYGWHNETLNIWSHIVGCIILIYLLAVSFPSSDVFKSTEVPILAKSIIVLFLVCGVKCMVSSVIWHTFSGTCKLAIRSRFSCIDYTGITVLITASIVTMEFVLWYRLSRKTMCLYMLTTLCSGVMGGWLNWLPKFDGPQSRIFRVALYGLMVLLGLISIAHHAVSHLSNSGLYLPVLRKSLIWYLIGVIFYATLIPERWRSDVTLPVERPNECTFQVAKRTWTSLWWVDYCCHSHFLWHVFVVLGVVGFYEAILDMVRLTWLQPLLPVYT